MLSGPQILRTIMLKLPEIQAVVGERIWHAIQQTQQLPCVILLQSSESPIMRLAGGWSTATQERIELRCLDTSYAGVAEVASAIMESPLSAYQAAAGDRWVSAVHFEDGRREFVLPDTARNSRHRYGVEFDVSLFHASR